MKILMFTIGYPPAQVGGTEVYVAGLVEGLFRRGHESEVVYLEEIPDGHDIEIRSELRQGIKVHALTVPRRYKTEFMIFDGALRSRLVSELCALAHSVEPDVVHVHPLQLGLESYVMEALRREGHHVVLTYHTPTVSCARGDLIYLGREVCDGRIHQSRCTQCLMHMKGAPQPLRAVAAALPLGYSRAVHRILRHPAARKVRSLVSLPLIIEERKRAWDRAIGAADRVVAVCEWARRVIIENGASQEKVVLSRHGRELEGLQQKFVLPPIPRFGFLGRLSAQKGIDVLIDAVARMKNDLKFEIEFFSPTLDSVRPRAEDESVIHELQVAARIDPRLRLRGSVSQHDLAKVLSTWDAILVPSLWLESGPQVVYEAFCAKTPVIGSRRGGIAELVREGETGFLFTPGDAGELAALLSRFAANPGELRALRSRIPSVRTTDDVTDDMLSVYRSIGVEVLPAQFRA